MPQRPKNKTWTYVGLGCATLMFLGFLACGGLYAYTKHKVDQAGGPQAYAGRMIAEAGATMALPALPQAEREEARRVLALVESKARSLDKADIQQLGGALERLAKAGKSQPNGQPDPDQARAFLAECRQVAERH